MTVGAPGNAGSVQRHYSVLPGRVLRFSFHFGNAWKPADVGYARQHRLKRPVRKPPLSDVPGDHHDRSVTEPDDEDTACDDVKIDGEDAL